MLACALLALACLSLAGLAPRILQVQTAPAAALLGLALAYPLWSWLRLRAAARFLALELRDLQGQGLPTALRLGGDLLDQRIAAVEQASRQLRALHHFVSESLRQLPSPTFVCDRQGHVLLANAAAHAYARSLDHDLRAGDSLPRLLDGLRALDTAPGPQAGSPLLTARALAAGGLPLSSEGRDGRGRSLMLLVQAFEAPPTTGWLITLVDISDLRSAQAQRDQAMQFISHDIRAPVASIITLLEMQRGSVQAPDLGMLLPRIEGYAQASLQLADDFVHLARAQQQALRQQQLDLGLVLDQAVESCWAQASAAHVQLEFSLPEQECPVLGDPGMLHRAAVNLIGNAIKYGAHGQPASGATVQCLLLQDAGHCRIAIRDHGPGMDAQAVARLSQPFERLDHHQHLDGAGLGLAFVRRGCPPWRAAADRKRARPGKHLQHRAAEGAASLTGVSSRRRARETKSPEVFQLQGFAFLVRLAGIEPTTPWFVAKYSIQLSYSRNASHCSSGFWSFQAKAPYFCKNLEVAFNGSHASRQRRAQ